MHPIDSSFTNYDTVTIEPIPNPTLCPYPKITTSFKNIVGKRAGVGDTLEIKGRNFGTTGGYVAFKDANRGEHRYTFGLESQYRLTWTDTLIRVLIPSYIGAGYVGSDPGCAGSGKVKVFTMAGDSAISSDTLHIEYAHINVKGNDGKINPGYLSKLYCINGFVFSLDSSLLGHNDIIEGIEFCLKQWSDFTGLRLELEKNSLGNVIFLKQESDLTYRNFISFKHLKYPNVMITSGPFLFGDKNPNNIFVRNTTTSISINDTLNYWLVPTGDKPSGYYDFIGTLLHELGHVLNIDHDVQYGNNLKSLMYYSARKSFIASADRENLNQWGTEAKNGVQYVIDQSKIQPLNDFPSVKPLFSGNIPILSAAPLISPSKDTILCAELVSTYTLSSNYTTNNRWNTSATSQSITLTPPSFPFGETELSRFYIVKRWNENCTIASNPSLPVKVTWKKYCLKNPGDDKFDNGDISTRSVSELNSKMYPNPFTSGIEIDIEDVLQGELIINVFNSNGDIVINKTLSVESGSFHDFVSMDKYISGIYTIKIQNGEKVNIQQIVKVE